MPWSNRPRCQAQNQNPRKGNIKGKDPGINKEPYTGLINTNRTVERSLSIHESRNLKQARSYTTRMLTCYASIALATPSRDIVVIISCCWYKVKQFVKINADNIVFSKYGNNGKKENSVRLSMMWDRKKRKSFVYGELIFLTEGGRSPTEVRKIKRFPFPAAFDWEISIQEQPSECYWSDTDTASSGFADLRRSKN